MGISKKTQQFIFHLIFLFALIYGSRQFLNSSFSHDEELSSKTRILSTDESTICARLDRSDLYTGSNLQDTGSFMSDFIKGTRENFVMTWLDSQLDTKNMVLLNNLLIFIVIPGAFGVISCLGLITCWFCNFIQCCRKLSCCCSKDPRDVQMEPGKIVMPGILALLTGVGMVSGTLVMIFLNEGTYFYFNKTECTFVSSLNAIQKGKNYQTSLWKGFNNIPSNIDVISFELEKNIAPQSSFFESIRTYKEDKISLETEIDNIFFNVSDMSAPAPDTKSNTTTYIRPNMLRSWGPSSYAFTYIGKIQQEYNATVKSVADGIVNLQTSFLAIDGDLINIVNQAKSSRKKVESINGPLNGFIDDGFKILKEADLFGTSIYGLINSLIAAFGISSLFTLFGVVFGLFGRNRRLRILLHVAWFLGAYSAALGFFMTAGLLPGSYLIADTCGTLRFMFSARERFRRWDQIIPSQTSLDLDTCYFDTGNMTNTINFTSSLSTLNQIAVNYNLVSKFNLTNPRNYTLGTNVVINEAKFELQNPNGSVFQVSDLEIFPPVAMLAMNSWTDYEWTVNPDKLAQGEHKNLCSSPIYKDIYVWDQVQCPNGTVKWPEGTSTAMYSVGQQVCIGILQMTKDMAKLRYATDYIGIMCQSSGATLSASLLLYHQRVYDFYRNYSVIFNNTLANVVSFQNQIYLFYLRSQTIKDYTDSEIPAKLNKTMELVSDSKVGLYNTLNCTGFKTDSEILIKDICNGLLPPIFQLTVFLAYTSFFAMLMSLFSMITVYRIIMIETWEKEAGWRIRLKDVDMELERI